MIEEPNKEEKKEVLIEKKDVWEKARQERTKAEQKELQERQLPAEEEKAIQEQLRKEIEVMEQDQGLKKEAGDKAKKIQFLGEEEKVKRLLEIAKEKGVAFTITVAKNMNDPYILDIFHDMLVKEGFFKKFLK